MKMRRLLNKKGMTITETLLAVAILSVIMLGALAAMMYVFSNNNAAIKLEEDRYNTRMALLSITRDAHQGVDRFPTDLEVGNNSLKLTMFDGTTVIEYSMNGNLLERTVTGGTSPVPFIPVELNRFETELNDKFLTIRLIGEHNSVIETTISLARTPTSRLS